MGKFDDRRQHPRKPLKLNVMLHVGGGGKRLKGVSVDLSRGGIFVRLAETLQIGQRVDVFIEPADGESGPIMVGGTVAHSVLGHGIGIEFTRATEAGLSRVQQLLLELKGI